jgi:sec-independent protein translocase protein TatA
LSTQESLIFLIQSSNEICNKGENFPNLYGYKLNDMNTYLFLGNLGLTEIIIIALIVLLLFGGKKIPELMKGLGKGVKSFKEGINDIEEDIKK